MRPAATPLLLTLLAACASGPHGVRGGELRNVSSSPITDVRAVFSPGERSLHVTSLDAGAAFRLSVSRVERARFDWVDGSGRKRRAEVGEPVGAAELREPGWVVFSLFADGNATAQVVPFAK